MAQIDQAKHVPSLIHDTLSEQTWASGNTKTITDANVRAGSMIQIMHTSEPVGNWYISSIADGTFTITSSDAETSATFKYRIN